MRAFYKMQQILLQNRKAILLQNAAENYYKMSQVFYYKMRQFYYKTATFIKKCDNFITKCDSYYKMRGLLQIATVHSFTYYLNSLINVL